MISFISSFVSKSSGSKAMKTAVQNDNTNTKQMPATSHWRLVRLDLMAR